MAGAAAVVFILPDRLRDTAEAPAQPALQAAAPSATAPSQPAAEPTPANDASIPPPPPATAAPTTPPPPAAAATRPTAPATTPAPGATPDPAKGEAERLLAEALKRQARLEGEGARQWGATPVGGNGYPEARKALDEANAQFDRQRFTEAAAGFRKAIDLFDRLAASKDERFRAAIAAGETALEAEDAAAAQKQFDMALVLKPGDADARKGLDRATRLPELLTHLAEGKRAEASGELDKALKAYRAAAKLDPDHETAKRGAARAKALIDERDYRSAVTRALAALDRKRFDDAKHAVQEANKIRTATPELLDISRRIQAEEQITRIAALRKTAAAQESREDWKAAAESYDKVLAIDPSVAFATNGRDRAATLATLYDQLALYIDQPQRLGSPEPLAHAKQALAAADAVPDPGPTLREKREAVRAQIAQAETPRPVLLQSDGATSVTLYRVARFGAFTQRRLELRPGTYTAVGSRPGYRDVRVQFSVPAGDKGETVVTVSCNERI